MLQKITDGMNRPTPTIRIADEPPSAWDCFLTAAGREASLQQSCYWSRFNEKTGRSRSYFLSLEDAGVTLSQSLILKRKQWQRSKIKGLILFPYLECIGGPVMPNAPDAASLTQMVVERVIRMGRRSLATHIIMKPSHTSRYASDGQVESIYRGHGFDVDRWGTFLVDLGQSEDELWAGLKRAAKKCIRKAQSQGLRMTRITDHDEFVERYWENYVLAEEHHGRTVGTLTMEQLQEDTEDNYRYYVAEDADSRVLACLGMSVFNGVATEIQSALSPAAFEEKIPAQDFLHWEMMLEARRIGCLTFDVAGVHPAPRSPAEAGIRRFKEKWGGRYVEYPIYRMNLMPLWSKLTRWTRRHRMVRNSARGVTGSKPHRLPHHSGDSRS